MILWATIGSKDCFNYGNRIIEFSIRQLLNNPETIDVSYWNLKTINNFNGINKIIIPGSTTLELPEFYELIKKVPSNIPIYNIGACFWQNPITKQGGGQNSIITKDVIDEYNKDNVYIGARDPYTLNLLNVMGSSKSINSKFIGCPTLWYNAPLKPNNYNVFSFGRQSPNEDFWNRDTSNFLIVLHEEFDKTKIPKNFNGKIININDYSALEIIQIYQGAKQVITGRLHGFLPSVGRVPTSYYGDVNDTRNSLLPYIGLNMCSVNNIEEPKLQKVNKPKDFDDFIKCCRESISESC